MKVKVCTVCSTDPGVFELQIVGDGNFAVVRHCYNKQTRKEFAVKIIDKVSRVAKQGRILFHSS